jgi:8-oxo-dGTP pyrophosphatase MutT (NUDIX family)
MKHPETPAPPQQDAASALTRVVGGTDFTHDWTPVASEVLCHTRVFTLRCDHIPLPGNRQRQGRFIVCECARWVNVVARTPEREIVLVRQWRVGTRRHSLEVPGGLVEPDEDPADAAARELREETGFTGNAPALLGMQEPNPAIQDNITYTYLIDNCQPTHPQQLDAGEEIAVELARESDLPELVRRGEIRHALVLAALYFLHTADTKS